MQNSSETINYRDNDNIKEQCFAPAVIFVYNRPSHTIKTIESLQKNSLAEDTDLIIFSDAPKRQEAITSVELVRTYIKTITGFKSITIIEQQENKGLAQSIIEGVTDVINKYGKAIIIEDDIITSEHFLVFMNTALAAYHDRKEVWHISGWNYPIDTSDLGDIFLWRTMNCWAWATWKDRWAHYEKSPKSLKLEFSKRDIKRFNLDGSHNFWKQVESNINGKINTWAVFWYATIFRNGGLCLNPTKSFAKNIGNDGSGVNCVDHDPYSNIQLNASNAIILDHPPSENILAVERIKQLYRSTKPNLFKLAYLYAKKKLKSSIP